MYIIGIDPGVDGAVAILDQAGAYIGVMSTPTLTLRVQWGTRREYDLPGMAQLLLPHTGNGAHAILEEAQAMPGQGVRSMFTVGLGFGLWLGLLSALQIPYTRIRPGVWKRAMGLSGTDKEAARLRAQQLFPMADLRRKADHGKAEALLLAEYGRWVMPGAERRPRPPDVLKR